ncbi:MAG: DUF5721 family protein [Eubacteriales bacterium]|nr:DUF5721 family protein [Eubacteriales bacterium]
MTSFYITELKNFMSKLLATNCFDSFLLAEANISTAVEYTIDGHINKDFYTREELEDEQICPYDFSPWSAMRPICYEIIKGKRSPSRFKFVFHLMPDYVPGVLKGADDSITPDQVKALVLTIKYENGAASIITGTAFHTFLMDKTLDAQWDKTMRQFLAKKGILYSEI